jgi:feruloyl esterase
MKFPSWPPLSVRLAPALIALLAPALDARQSCDQLAGLKLPHTAIVSSTLVPEGPFTASGPLGALPPVTVPARCVVKGVARPTSDSEIKFELWLPAAGWNGKYQQAGNGGWAGAIPTQSLIEPLRRGYATAATDDGHQGGATGASWAIGHPEKLVDFGYRAVHETGLQAKAIVRVFYGKDPARSYFVGCSDGGREALMEAQRYPQDFDGIVAGAPANNWSRLMAGAVWNEKALLDDPSSSLPPSKLPAIQKAALAACDALDGVRDGLIEDPRACHFDPAALKCKAGDSPECLTPPQVEAVRKIYSGAKNPRTGAQISPGYPPGTEAGPGGWSVWIAAAPPQAAVQFAFGNSFYADAVFENPKWDFRTMNFDKDVAAGDEKAGSILNSSSPDLRAFRARGGKLIQYHGWGDPAISALSSIDYYGRVGAFLAKDPGVGVQDFYRLFLVPGMGHCGGGAGPNSFGNVPQTSRESAADPQRDIVSALDRWVEKGAAPDKIIGAGTAAGDPSEKITRPLCPYPEVAHYNGTGDPNDAASFACLAPPNPR